MTIKEALDRRIPRVRMAAWGLQTDYLRLPLLANGLVGPWAELYSRINHGAERILLIGHTHDGPYEEYTGPVSPLEAHEQNLAKTYAES